MAGRFDWRREYERRHGPLPGASDGGAPPTPPAAPAAAILVDLADEDRALLERMAAACGRTPADLAQGLLADVLRDDAAAEGEGAA